MAEVEEVLAWDARIPQHIVPYNLLGRAGCAQAAAQAAKVPWQAAFITPTHDKSPSHPHMLSLTGGLVQKDTRQAFRYLQPGQKPVHYGVAWPKPAQLRAISCPCVKKQTCRFYLQQYSPRSCHFWNPLREPSQGQLNLRCQHTCPSDELYMLCDTMQN